jgi:hypothetical protein
MDKLADLKRMIYLIDRGLKGWEKSQWKKVPQSLYEGHMLLIKHMYLSNNQAPTNLYDFMQFLHKSFESWQIDSLEQIFPLDASFLVDGYGVSGEIEDFIEMFISPEEDQQSTIKQILLYCRAHKLDEEYREVRSLLTDRSHVVLSAFKLKQLLNKVKDKNLRQLVDKCYEEIPQPIQNYRKCPHCGWTLTFKGGHWLCNKEDSCRYFASFETLEKFTYDSETRVYRLTPGVQKYTLLTGIIEQKIFQKLSAYSPILYPEIDQYDIAITVDEKPIYLDVKDYKSPLMLANFFNKKPKNELKKYEQSALIVIPNYRIQQLPSYVELFYSKLEKDVTEYIRIISERDLYKRLKEESL